MENLLVSEINNNEEENSEKKKNYKLYKWRWLVLSSYCVLSLANAPTSTAFPAVSNILQKYYNVEAMAIHMLLGLYSITMAIIILLFSYILHRYELACVLIISATLNLIGGVIRYFGDSQEYGYFFVLAGNVFCALSISGYMFLPPKLGQNWFGENEQGRVNGICIGFDMVATALGFFHSTQVIHNRSDPNKTKSDIKTLVLQQLIAAGVAMVITCVFSQSKPKSPPSAKEEKRLEEEKLNETSVTAKALLQGEKNDFEIDIKMEATNNKAEFWKYIKILLKHKDFLLIIHIASITLAVEILFEMILNDILIEKFPGKEKAIGMVGFVAIVLGFFSNISVGYVIDKTKAYKKITNITYIIALLCLIAWTLLLQFYHSFILLGASFCLFVFINTSYYVTSTTHMVVVTNPIPPGSSSMILLIVTAFYGTVISFAGSFLLKHTNALLVNISILLLMSLAFIMTLFLRKDKTY